VCNTCAICCDTCLHCHILPHIPVVQDEEDEEKKGKKGKANAKAIEEKAGDSASGQSSATDSATSDAAATTTATAAATAFAAAALAKDPRMYADDKLAGGQEEGGKKDAAGEGEGNKASEGGEKRDFTPAEVEANKKLGLLPSKSDAERSVDLDVLGACFSLTPESRVEDIEEKRTEISKAKIRGCDAFRSHFMSADTKDVYLTGSIRTIVGLRAKFLELVEMYALRHKIVEEEYDFEEPQSTVTTPRK
tara:strand:+ start:943 stop:1689 length:747 start_codon:yes stop_codon:yes gene_type:complete